jgi:proteasome lid subunit RPN8/RPN11
MLNNPNSNKEEKIEIAQDWKVYIRNNAFRKMLSHIMRFANKSLEDNQEVMGICIGEVNSEDNTLNLMNIIPVCHGDIVELGFSQEVHEKIMQIEEKIIATNLNMIGWYHSRLKGGLFFSHADRSNQLYFQNEKQPYGFGIIFDNNLLNPDNKFGFEIFRFKNFSNGIDSEYVKVPFELEVPKTLEFFKWVEALVEDLQRKNPIVINEFDEVRKLMPGELQEIPKVEDVAIENGADDFNAQIQPIFTGFKEGTSQFAETFIDAYKNQLSNWMIDVRKGSLKGIEQIRSVVNQMKDSFEQGLEKIQTYFDTSFSEISNVFIKNISEYIDKRVETQKEFKTKVSDLFEEIYNEIQSIIENNLKEFTDRLKEKMSYEEVKLYNINQINTKIKPLLNKSSDLLAKTYNNTNALSDDLIDEIKRLSSRFSLNLNEEIENLNLDSDPIREKYKEIEELIERLQKVISDFRQLK